MARSECLQEAELVALLSGRLPPAEAGPLAEHTATCPRCSERLSRLAREAAFEVRGPALRERSAARAPDSATPSWPLFAGLAAGIVIAVLLIARSEREPRVIAAPPPPAAPPAFSLRAFARTPAGIEEISEKARLRPGDRVRFALEAHRGGFLLVVSIDSRGRVEALYPRRGSGARSLAAGRREFLPGALEIGPSDLPRRIFALFATSPLSLGAVRAAVPRGSHPLRWHRLPVPGVQQWTLLIEEAVPPG